MTKLEAIEKQFQRAVASLDDVLQQEKNEYIRDSAIKRFEFTFDLSWKFIKTFLEEHKGVVCASPKGCFKEAYAQNMIEYDDFWIEMTDWRNQTAHLYKEKLAEEIYALLPKTLVYFQKLLKSAQATSTRSE